MPSIYFEDFSVGRVFELGSVTVTEKSIIEFASQFDPQSFHIDPEAAVDSSFGGLIASGWHTGSLWMRLYADALLLDADSRGSPGIEEVRWRAPVRPDDTLTGTTTVVDAQPSSKDPMRGTVFIESAMTNQDGVVVMTMKSRGMFGRRKA
ncbi:MAG: dehydratase [Ilumatobacter sp.]|nr:dehydratase [Ilumatobacter sp.]